MLKAVCWNWSNYILLSFCNSLIVHINFRCLIRCYSLCCTGKDETELIVLPLLLWSADSIQSAGTKDICMDIFLKVRIVLLFFSSRTLGSGPVSTFSIAYLFWEFLEITIKFIVNYRRKFFLTLKLLQDFLSIWYGEYRVSFILKAVALMSSPLMPERAWLISMMRFWLSLLMNLYIIKLIQAGQIGDHSIMITAPNFL